MKLLLPTLLLPVVVLFSCNNSSTNRGENPEVKMGSTPTNTSIAAPAPKKKTKAELKAELRDRECSSPSKLLSGNLKLKPRYRNALSMKVKGLKIDCTIFNDATIATFKDIKAKATFLSKTGSVILTKEFDIYEFIGPKRSINYKSEFGITNQQFDDIATFEWIILDASCN